MGKKIVKIGNKTYVVDSDSKSVEEVDEEDKPVEDTPAEDTPKVEETPAEETPAGDGDVDEEKVDEVAQKIMKSLGVDKLRNDLKQLSKEVKDSKKDTKIAALVDLEKMMQKDVSEMTSREKIVGFFQAMVQSNHGVLKALFLDSVLAYKLSLNWVNCWEALKVRVISSQAYAVMRLKVQRLVSESYGTVI